MHSGSWIEASVEIVKIENSNRHQKYETDCSVQRQKQEQDHICKEQKRRIGSELLKTTSPLGHFLIFGNTSCPG